MAKMKGSPSALALGSWHCPGAGLQQPFNPELGGLREEEITD